MVSLPHWSLENGNRLVDGEHCLFKGEATLASTLVDVRSVVKFVRHRAVDYAFA
jgi:hypothetical protein